METKERRVLFVFVEGVSDMISLKGSFEQAFPEKRVMFYYYRGDITTEDFVDASNIEERIYEEVYYRLRQTSLDFDDVAEIIHIIDTDGVYIENKRVLLDKSRQHPYYDSGKGVIRTWNKYDVEDRNYKKREVIDCLVECDNLFGTPYRVFYMACNLDHVLHGEPNTQREMKRQEAKRFAVKYRGDLPGFVRFIAESPFSVAGGYHKSWDILRYDDHGLKSIRQATNLGLVFRAIK